MSACTGFGTYWGGGIRKYEIHESQVIILWFIARYVPPRFHRVQPASVCTAVETELHHMKDAGIIHQADYSDWVILLVHVQKANENMYLCGDYEVQ